MAYTILLVDDEAEIRELLRLYLENDNYRTIEAGTGVEALNILAAQEINLVILDIMMPGMDGFRVLQKIREKSNIQVIMLSAKDQSMDKVMGLNLGADDYISKPFDPVEVVARVKSAIRRYYALGADRNILSQTLQYRDIRVGDLFLEGESCTLYCKDEPVDLTSAELRVMNLLMEHPGKVYTKQQIYEYAWGESDIAADNNIMVCISKIRTKLDPEDALHYIKTVRGLGYRLERPKEDEN